VTRVFASIGEFAWGVLTYFVVPVILFENVSTKKSIKRSGSVIKKTWGEAFFGSIGMGLYFLLYGLIGLVFPLVGYLLFGTTGLIIGLVAFAVYAIVLAVIYSAAGGVLTAALYRYARTGDLYPDYPSDMIQPVAHTQGHERRY